MTRAEFRAAVAEELRAAGATDLAWQEREDDEPGMSFSWRGGTFSWMSSIPLPPGDSGAGIRRDPKFTPEEARAGMLKAIRAQLTAP